MEAKNKYNISPQEKKRESIDSPSKKHDIDLRLNNISSINDKITGLLNVTRSKKPEDRPNQQGSPIKEKVGNSEKPKQLYPNYTSRYVYEE